MEDWLDPLAKADVPHAPVLDYAGEVEHEQFWENGYFQEIEHAQLGTMQVPGPPIKMSVTPTKISGGGPELGMHTEEYLLELGYSWEEITQLRDVGAL